jgi:hypothetical protein
MPTQFSHSSRPVKSFSVRFIQLQKLWSTSLLSKLRKMSRLSFTSLFYRTSGITLSDSRRDRAGVMHVCPGFKYHLSHVSKQLDNGREFRLFATPEVKRSIYAEHFLGLLRQAFEHVASTASTAIPAAMAAMQIRASTSSTNLTPPSDVCWFKQLV